MARWTAPPEALRRRWKTAAAALLAIVAIAFALPARAESRFALVIGNGAYKNVPALANPPNDAKDIAAALKSLGFKVTLKLNLDLVAMQRAIEEFALEFGGRRRFAVLLRGTRPPARRPQLPRSGRRGVAQARRYRDADSRARSRARRARQG